MSLPLCHSAHVDSYYVGVCILTCKYVHINLWQVLWCLCSVFPIVEGYGLVLLKATNDTFHVWSSSFVQWNFLYPPLGCLWLGEKREEVEKRCKVREVKVFVFAGLLMGSVEAWISLDTLSWIFFLSLYRGYQFSFYLSVLQKKITNINLLFSRMHLWVTFFRSAYGKKWEEPLISWSRYKQSWWWRLCWRKGPASWRYGAGREYPFRKWRQGACVCT